MSDDILRVRGHAGDDVPSDEGPGRTDDPSSVPLDVASLPVLPLRNTVILPIAVAPITVGRKRSLAAVDAAMREGRVILCVKQKDAAVEEPEANDLPQFGTLVTIQQMRRVGPDVIACILQGAERVRIDAIESTDPHLRARFHLEEAPEDGSLEVEAAARSVRDLFQRLVPMLLEVPDMIGAAVESVENPLQLVYMVASLAPVDADARQELLDLDTLGARLRLLVEILQHELEVRELGRKIASDAEKSMTRAQREYHLREQLQAIRRELGEEGSDALEDLRVRLEQVQLPEEAHEEVEREMRRLERLPSSSPEVGYIRTYLEWMADLPWGKRAGGKINVDFARRILDADHYGLETVKERILEHLAVRRMRQDRGLDEVGEHGREPILCFVGPPGVGKTSLGQSIARAIGREFVRISLGGVHEEPELRGHRRTYIGAMPGRIIQSLRKCGTGDPIFMLDEIDKLGRGFHGDPAAALLEVLDPAQNSTFTDHYLGVPYDLSRVLFITTANDPGMIPGPLYDRMEVIHLPGYTEEEKVEIAKRHLLDKQLDAHALEHGELVLEDEALKTIIRRYTREAGVRNLDRMLAKVCRKQALRIAEGHPDAAQAIDVARLVDMVGSPKTPPATVERIDRPGVATGMAWTPVGGELLYVEAALVPGGSGRLTLTGSLGEVMQESAQTALSLIRSRAHALGVDPTAFEGKDVHIHVPSGAIPKDGPSAGVTMVVALASALTNLTVRNDLSMTGEITLRGKVLPVGGVKEKVLAAARLGIDRIVLPRWNGNDLEDIPDEVRNRLHVTLVDTIEEVLAEALPARVLVPHPG